MTQVIDALSRQLDRKVYEAHQAWLEAGGNVVHRVRYDGR